MNSGSPTAVPCLLAHAKILELSGPDACAFAHSQFSSDVNRLAIGDWQWSAWLDASGRVRNLFALLRTRDDQLLAWLPRGDAGVMMAALRRFVFRSKVTMSLPAGYQLLSLSEADHVPPDNTIDFWTLDLRGSAGRRAAIVKGSTLLEIDGHRYVEWQRENIKAGLPWISAEVSAEFTPQALGLPQLGAISLDKGCYPGQETVARLHFRGGNKRERVHLQCSAQIAPASGDVITIETDPPSTGRILYAAIDETGRCDALAILPIGLMHDLPLSLSNGSRLTRLALKAN